MKYSLDGKLSFEEEKHIYRFEGIKIPSVTSIISYEFPERYLGVEKEVLHNAASKGIELHRLIEEYEKNGTIDEESIMYERFKRYLELKEIVNFKVLESESIVYYKKGLIAYAGTVDNIGELLGKVYLSDTKSYNRKLDLSEDSEDYKMLQLQLTGYAIAYEQLNGKKIEQLNVIHIPKGRGKFITIKRDDEYFMEVLERNYFKALENIL